MSNEDTVSITVEALPPSPWRNARNPFDVDDSGAVVTLDVLIINVLNSRGPFELPDTPREVPAPPPYLDPSGDYLVSALDALVIVNFLNARTGVQAEAEAEGLPTVTRSLVTPTILASLSPRATGAKPVAASPDATISDPISNPATSPHRREAAKLRANAVGPMVEVEAATMSLEDLIDLALTLETDWRV